MEPSQSSYELSSPDHSLADFCTQLIDINLAFLDEKFIDSILFKC